jgi:hypothetical protein
MAAVPAGQQDLTKREAIVVLGVGRSVSSVTVAASAMIWWTEWRLRRISGTL